MFVLGVLSFAEARPRDMPRGNLLDRIPHDEILWDTDALSVRTARIFPAQVVLHDGKHDARPRDPAQQSPGICRR